MSKVDKLKDLLEVKISRDPSRLDFDSIGGGLTISATQARFGKAPNIIEVSVGHYSGGREVYFKKELNVPEVVNKNVVEEKEKIKKELLKIAIKYENDIVNVLKKLGYK